MAKYDNILATFSSDESTSTVGFYSPTKYSPYNELEIGHGITWLDISKSSTQNNVDTSALPILTHCNIVHLHNVSIT